MIFMDFQIADKLIQMTLGCRCTHVDQNEMFCVCWVVLRSGIIFTFIMSTQYMKMSHLSTQLLKPEL